MVNCVSVSAPAQHIEMPTLTIPIIKAGFVVKINFLPGLKFQAGLDELTAVPAAEIF